MESMLFKKKSPLFLFLTPAILFMAVFLFYPFVVNIYMSFFHVYTLGANPSGWNNFENYKRLVNDPRLLTALLNTLKMMALVIVFQLGFALLLACFTDAIKVGGKFFRTVYFFPIVISATALGLMFNLMFQYQDGASGGMINQIIVMFGGKPVDFFSGKSAFWAMSVPVLWQYVGFYFVIILAGITGIPEDIYESGAIDGATGLKRFWYLTLPLLRNVLITSLILNVTGALKVFDLPWTMLPNGMPFGSTYLLGTYMYDITYNYAMPGYGAVIAIVIVLLGIVLSQIINGIFKSNEE